MIHFGPSGLSANRSCGCAALASISPRNRLGVGADAAGRDANLHPARGGRVADPDAKEGSQVETLPDFDQLLDDDEAWPGSPRNAAVAAKLAEHAADTQTPAGFVNLGKAKHKVNADPTWWKVGLHQILLYIGTSRQGQGSRASANERRRVRKGSGKGK